MVPLGAFFAYLRVGGAGATESFLQIPKRMGVLTCDAYAPGRSSGSESTSRAGTASTSNFDIPVGNNPWYPSYTSGALSKATKDN